MNMRDFIEFGLVNRSWPDRWLGAWSCLTCRRRNFLDDDGEVRCTFCQPLIPRRYGARDRSYALHADRRAGEGWRYNR